MANNKPFIVKSGLVPQTHNDQDLGHATSKFANAHISNLAGAVQINSAFTLPTADGTAEQVIKTDGAGNLSFTTISTNFLGLTDVTPNSFTGQAGKVVSVNTAENAVEFVDISTDFLGLTDVTPNSFTGQAGKVVQVNTLENAIEFVDLAAVTFSDAAPSTPQSGDLWFDSGTNAELFIWTGTEWISTTGGDQAAFTMRDFTGDNTTTVFSTGVGSNVSAFVYLNGVLLKETTDYSFANGDVTFVTAPFLNDVIQVMLHGQAEYLTLGTLGGSTDDVTEGSTNLYYTDARVQTKLGNISGHILPDTNDTYDIGSASLKIRDLYLGSNTLHIGDADITSTGTKVELPTGSTIGGAEAPQVNLSIAPETLEIQVDAPDMGQATMWKWTWEQSTLPYARRTITNSNELNVPLYKEGTYVVNNFAAYDIHGSMTQTHSLYLKWVDGAGTDNLVSWATSAGPISDTHPDINGGNATDVQRITVNVPATITLPTLTNPSVSYTVVNNASGGYTFSGSAKGDNPNLGPFYRGGTYTVNINATGHPFYFTTDNGTNFSAGTYFGEYTSGVTGSRTDSGTITFTVPANAPDTLYYQCGNHSAMRGAITVKDLAVETNINGNYVVYFQHTQEGHRTPVELRPIPSLVNQMCLVYDNNTNKFVPQDLATYVENTPSFENKIREVAGTAELVVEDGSAVIAKVNVYDDSTYLPLTGNNPGDQAFATDTDILYIWDGSAWQQAGAANSDDLTEGSTNLFFTNARVSSYLSSNDFDTATNIVASITDSAPATLDTLNELAAALGDDPNFATTTANNIATKLPLAGGAMTGDLTITSNANSADGNLKVTSNTPTNYPAMVIQTSTGGNYTETHGLYIKNTAAGYGLRIDDETNDTSPFVVDTEGRVGIGTDSPQQKLHILGASNQLRLEDSGNNKKYDLNVDLDKFMIDDMTAGVNRFAISGSNVGIGTTNPTVKLTTAISHSNGAVAEGLKLTTDGSYSSGNSEEAGPAISFGQFHTQYPTWKTGQISGIRDGASWNGSLSFWTNNGSSETDISEKMRITGAGNVGIGTTGPGAKLSVSGPAALANLGGGSTGSAALYVNTTSGHIGEMIQVLRNGAIKMYMANDGDLALGHSSPSDKLDVQGADNGITIRSALANRPKLSLINDSSTMLTLSANGTYAAIGDGADANRYMSFRGGKVGVGDTDPDTALHVAGNVKVGSAASSSWATSIHDAGGLDVVVGSGSHALQLWDDNSQSQPRFEVERAGKVTMGTTIHLHESRYSGAFNVSGSSQDYNLMMPSFYGSGSVNQTYRHCFNINTSDFSVLFEGGGGNTVFTTYAKIQGSHYRDISVRTHTLYYSDLKIKIIQDNSEAKSVWVAGATYSNNVYSLRWRVYPTQASVIQMNPSSSQSAWYHVHHATGGLEHSSESTMPSGSGPSSW